MSTPATILTLKVFIETTQQTKTFRFSGDEAIAEIIKEIREKTGEGGADYGIFVPPNPVTKTPGQWLERNRALRFYNIKNDFTIEYKKRHRPLPVRTVDGAEKKILVDDGANARALSDAVGEKLGLGKHAEQFGLAFPGSTHKNPKWFNEAQTLHEQGYTPGTTLEYLKRYSVLDSEVSATDAHVLHLLYMTTAAQILQEVYPITRNDARDFAALQLQITFGDHNPDKHKPGFADLSLFVPPAFLKMKDKEEQKKFYAEIYRDHKKLKGCKDNVAKTRYIQLARSLKTYGFNFFDVTLQTEEQKTETPRKKGFARSITSKKGESTTPRVIKKSVKTTFGVSLNKFCLYDTATNQFTEVWPFHAMKSWDVFDNVCNIDFSSKDYEFSLKLASPEAEVIAQTISGYITIILRLKKEKGKVISNSSGEVGEIDNDDADWGDSGLTLMSSYMNPALQGAGQGTFMGMGGGPGNPGANTQKEANLTNVNSLPSALRAAQLLSKDLASGKGAWGKKGALTEENWQKQFDRNRAQLQDDLKDFLGACTLVDGKLDRKALDVKCTAMHMNVASLVTAARNLAILNEDNAPLLDGAKALCDSLTDLMGLVMNSEVTGDYTNLADILAASQKQFAAANLLLQKPSMDSYVDEGTKLLLLNCIGAVDTQLTSAIKTARTENPKFLTPEEQKTLENELKKAEAIKGIALSTMANLVPHLANPQALEHIHIATDMIKATCDGLQRKYKATGKAVTPPLVLAEINEVETALKMLYEASNSKEHKSIEGNIDIITPAVQLLNSLAGFRAAVMAADPYRMNKETLEQEEAANQLVAVIRRLAPQLPQLKTALEMTADAIENNMKALSKESHLLQTNPTAPTANAVGMVAEIEKHVQNLISSVGQQTAVNNLRFEAKNVAAHMIRLISTSKASDEKLSQAQKDILLRVARDMGKGLSELLGTLQVACENPDDAIRQQHLAEGVKKQLPTLHKFVSKLETAAATIPADQVGMLPHEAQQGKTAVQNLEKASDRISEMQGNLLITQALSSLDLVKADLETAACFAEQGRLALEHNLTVPQALEKLGQAIQRVKVEEAHLINAAKGGNKESWPDTILATSEAVEKVSQLAVLTARALPERLAQTRVLASALKSLNDTHDLIAASRVLVHDPLDVPAHRVLANASQILHHDLDTIRTSATGFNPTDLEQAQRLLMSLRAGVEISPNLEGQHDLARVHQLAAAKLKPAARAVNLPLASFVQTAETLPSHIGYEAKVTVNSIGNLLSLTNLLAFTAPDQKSKEEIMAVSRLICDEVGALLKTSHDIALRSPGAVEKADATAKQISNTIHNTLWATVKAAPSSSTDAAVTRIMQSLLDNEPGPYGVPKEEVVRDLQEGVTGLKLLLQNVPKVGSSPEQVFFCEKAAQFIEDIMTAAQVAQISDGSKPLLSNASIKIVEGCQLIIDHSNNKPYVNGVVEKIAGLAPHILDASKEGIAITPTEEGRQKIMAATKAVGVALNRLVEENKAGCTPEQARLNAVAVKDKVLALQAELNDPVAKPHVVVSKVTAENILTTARALAVPATNVVRATTGAPGSDIKTGLNELNKNINALETLCKNLERSNEERAKAIQAMQKASADLDTTLLFASIGLLESGEKTKIQQTQVVAKDVCKQTGVDMKQLVTSVKTGQPKDLYEASVGFQHSVPKFVEQINLVAAQMDNPEKAEEVLVQSKKFSESLKELTESTIAVSTSDPTTVKAFGNNFQNSSTELAKLLTLLNTGVQAQNKLDEAIAAINASLVTLDKPVNNGDFDTCNQKLQQAARNVGSAMTLLLNAESEEQVLAAATQIQAAVPALIDASRAATHAAKQDSAKEAIQANAAAVGTSVLVGLEKVKGILVGSGEKPQLLRAFQQTNKALAAILSSSSSDLNDPEVLLLDRAAASLLESLAALNAQKMDVISGQPREAPTQVSILDLAKTIDQNLHQLKPLAGQLRTEQSHPVLAQTGKNLSSNVANVVTPSIQAVSRLPPQDQVPFVENLADVVLTSSKLLVATKAKFKDPQAVNQIAQEEKQLAEQIEKVKNILGHLQEANAATTKKLKNDISAVEKANKAFGKGTQPKADATPAELKQAAKAVLATVEGIKAATTDEEATKLSAQLPAELENLYAVSLGVPEHLSKDLLDDFLAAARSSGDALLAFMNMNATIPPRSPASVAQNKATLAPSSQQVVSAVGGLVDLIKKLPVERKEANLKELTVDPNDLEAFAESELLKCAAAIKEAAALLIKAAPPKKNVSVGLDTADINEAILEAARAIAGATGNLIQCAAVSQAERKEDAKKGANKYFADPAWSNGLVSAAQSVAAQVKALVEAANLCAGGAAEQERLIACARAVATTTIHLVTASRTKSDPSSNAQRNLSKASQEVTVSTGQLVVAANAAATLAESDDEEDFTKLNFAAASGIRAQMEQRGRIDKLEKELRDLRQELLNIRRARYQKEK